MKCSIHLNQIGFLKNGKKTATFVGKNINKFIIADKSGNEVYTGTPLKSFTDTASKDLTSQIDFSDFCEEGEYCIKSGSVSSYFFTISQNPYNDLLSSAIKSFYFSRCGCTLHTACAGIYRRKKCHTENATLLSDNSIKLDVTGGWHDAGDYGRYVVTAATALGHLLYSYILFPKVVSCDLNIHESGNGVPDILNECRYELEWLLKMQDRDGGVFHKAASKLFPPNILPCDDESEIFIFDKSTSATACFCAVTALASRIYNKYDSKFARKLKASSLNAWAWLLNNPITQISINPYKYLSAEYSDKNTNDDIFWAACELYSLTGDECFEDKIEDLYFKINMTSFTWLNVGGFGALSYIKSKRQRNELIIDSIKSSFIFKAENIVSMSKHSGYSTACEGNKYLWGSNMEILSYAMALIIADSFSHDENYINAAQEQLNYILGKNPMGKCYITGFGSDPVRFPHHRPSTADDVEEPIPGMLVGGPDMLRSDDYSRWLIPKGTPPAKCYVDKEYSFSVNEVSVSWNSALVFVLAYFSNHNEGDVQNGDKPDDKDAF